MATRTSLFESWLAWPDAWGIDTFGEEDEKPHSLTPEAQRAHAAVFRAVQRGDLPDLKEEFVKCEDCPRRATAYDHRCYDLPLEVTPVCKSCNAKRGGV